MRKLLDFQGEQSVAGSCRTFLGGERTFEDVDRRFEDVLRPTSAASRRFASSEVMKGRKPAIPAHLRTWIAVLRTFSAQHRPLCAGLRLRSISAARDLGSRGLQAASSRFGCALRGLHAPLQRQLIGLSAFVQLKSQSRSLCAEPE
jgi:hypothetical protein